MAAVECFLLVCTTAKGQQEPGIKAHSGTCVQVVPVATASTVEDTKETCAGKEVSPRMWVPAVCPTCDHATEGGERRSCLQRTLLL